MFLLFSFCVCLTVCTEELRIFLKCGVCIIHSKWRAAAIQHFGNSVVSGCIVPIYLANYVGLGLFTIVISANYGWTRTAGDLCSQQSMLGIKII